MRVCANCGHPLLGRRPQTRFCSGACRAAASRARAAQGLGVPSAVVPPSPDPETAQKPHTAAREYRDGPCLDPQPLRNTAGAMHRGLGAALSIIRRRKVRRRD
jgi:hypothetical protein